MSGDHAVTKSRHSRRRAFWWHLSGAPSAAAGPELTDQQALTCPHCYAGITRPTDKRLGYCCACGDFTGLCAAGRFATYRYAINALGWHRPCTALGVDSWEITVAATVRRVLLCAHHSTQVRDGRAPWVHGAPIPRDHPHG